MKVAIHQPNYLPWIGYFDKLDQVDQFVILDKALHSKSSFVHRSKIKTPNGSLTLTVPLKNKGRPINELQIVGEDKWQKNHWRAIEANYKKSAYWHLYKEGFEQLYQRKWVYLAPFNIALIRHIQSLLNISTEIVLESDFQRDFGNKNERNINIVSHLGSDFYLSGTGARVYNDESLFHRHQIQVVYQDFKHPIYPQRWGEFQQNLSILDMLFHCGPKTMDIIRQQRSA